MGGRRVEERAEERCSAKRANAFSRLETLFSASDLKSILAVSYFNSAIEICIPQ